MITIPIWVLISWVYFSVAGYTYAIDSEPYNRRIPILTSIFWPVVLLWAIITGLWEGMGKGW